MAPVVSSAAKARIAAFALVGLALWPLAHRLLVMRFELDPWRYWGFAMYCYPKTDLRVGFTELSDAGPERLAPSALPESVERELRRFRHARRARGSLPPDAVAQSLRDARPDLGDLRIEVRTLRFDVASARFREVGDEYLYRGSGRRTASARPR